MNYWKVSIHKSDVAGGAAPERDTWRIALQVGIGAGYPAQGESSRRCEVLLAEHQKQQLLGYSAHSDIDKGEIKTIMYLPFRVFYKIIGAKLNEQTMEER